MKEIPVTFKSHGKQIVGMLHLPSRKNAPLIIMCHGWTGNKQGVYNAFFVKAARNFSKNGFATLRFDFRGSGDSEGRWKDQTTTTMLEDLDNVIDQISKYPEINKEKIGLIGHSQGGRVVLLHTAKDKRIESLVTWAARTDLSYFWSKAWLESARRKERVIEDFEITKKWISDDMKYNVEKTVQKIKVPILVIHGDTDYTVPDSEAYRIYKNANKPKKLQIVKGLNHDFSGEKIQKEVIKITLNWFKKWLK